MTISFYLFYFLFNFNYNNFKQNNIMYYCNGTNFGMGFNLGEVICGNFFLPKLSSTQHVLSMAFIDSSHQFNSLKLSSTQHVLSTASQNLTPPNLSSFTVIRYSLRLLRQDFCDQIRQHQSQNFKKKKNVFEISCGILLR